MNLLLPFIAAWLSVPVFLLLDGRKRAVSALATVLLSGVCLVDVWFLVQLLTGARSELEITTGSWPAGIGIRLHVRGLSLLFGAVCAGVLAAAMLHEGRKSARSRLLPALLLTLCAGLHGAFFTGDLFNFYVFFELTVVSSFALAAYGYGRAEIRGAFVYVILNFFGSVLFLMGVTIVYYVAGTLDMQQLSQVASAGTGAPSLVVPTVLLFVALTIKVGLFPFHVWVPVLYSHARPAVAAALAGALINIGVFGLLSVGYSLLESPQQVASGLLLALGLAAAVYGAVLSLSRSRPDESAAYMAIAHSGYLVVALGMGGEHGLGALLVGVVTGSVDKAAMFLGLNAAAGARSLACFVAASSTAGVPLTLGFLFKLELLRAALQTDLHWAALGLLLTSFVVLIAAAFRFWRGAESQADPQQLRKGSLAPLALASVTLVLGVWPDPVHRAALTLSAHLQQGGF